MSSMSDFRYSGGTPDGPISPDAWKRAVYRRPPRSFHVKLLPPGKQGNSYSYGFRICPIKSDAASITTCTSSGDSIVSVDEYDIWRKWEDCLWFQDTLEVEYTRAAREKRSRLAAGKGVKKNGVYIHSDQAASWESLPFGPDPSDIARDIHKHIPKLSKKGTLFRASQDTVAQRFEDLQKMMHALMQDDLPTLIKDIKATRTFTDFFGVWRRDVDLARKTHPLKRSSEHSSTWSLSAKGKESEKLQVPYRASIHSDSSSSEDFSDLSRSSQLSSRRQDSRSLRSRPSSSESRSSSSSPPTPVTTHTQLPSNARQPVVASQDAPVRFGHNPNNSHAIHGDRSPSMLESLPEDRELLSSPKSDVDSSWLRRHSGSTASRMNRSARIYLPSPSGSPQSSDTSLRSVARCSKVTLQSRYSSATLGATSYLDELDVDYCLPSPTPEPRSHPRASISSMASLMTNASVDAVIPRNERPSGPSTRPLSFSDEPWSEGESQPEDHGDILDTYFGDLIGPHSPTSSEFPETPTTEETAFHFPSRQPCTYSVSSPRHSGRRSSITPSVSSGSTSTSGGHATSALSIKAMHENNIVMLRLPRDVTFDALRRKIYDKFIQSEGATICASFAIALMEPVGARSACSTHKSSALQFIASQEEWEHVVATHEGKLLLRAIGSRE